MALLVNFHQVNVTELGLGNSMVDGIRPFKKKRSVKFLKMMCVFKSEEISTSINANHFVFLDVGMKMGSTVFRYVRDNRSQRHKLMNGTCAKSENRFAHVFIS